MRMRFRFRLKPIKDWDEQDRLVRNLIKCSWDTLMETRPYTTRSNGKRYPGFDKGPRGGVNISEDMKDHITRNKWTYAEFRQAARLYRIS